MNKAYEERIFQLHAQVCKTLANPVRLRIMNCLRKRELAVSAIIKALGIRKSNLSQHLAVLRQLGIVKARRKGLNVYYSITNPKMVEACDILREVLFEQLRQSGRLAKKI